MADIEIPDGVYEAMELPEPDRDATMKTELAVSLYDRGVLSFGKARQLADHSAREFHRLLGDRQIERHYTSEELDEDLDYARE
ncbi:UPF0175 family protein [Halococcoides cellulosivorans]|uniref:Uncharacterized protein n=1 Tax=Halococcoides cellulosivorans TaxID=1679096 RepID=A0A2R4X003_9EURY|nr:UPF0175 family protein [Halococcoides cellulosivorans]AWB27132.1 hypothetical protein HARCEL1_05130 [Halococcoides cellulosivorans]